MSISEDHGNIALLTDLYHIRKQSAMSLKEDEVLRCIGEMRGLCTLQTGGASETSQVEYVGADMFDRFTKAQEQSWGKKLALVDLITA